MTDNMFTSVATTATAPSTPVIATFTPILDPKVPTAKAPEMVDHPDHYASGRKYEPIDVIEDWKLNFHTGNAVRYISRVDRKLDTVEDLKKAIWYLEREIQRRTT